MGCNCAAITTLNDLTLQDLKKLVHMDIYGLINAPLADDLY